MRSSLKDIADRVGVTPQLVSFYLNHRETTRVKKETREKIDEAVRQLNYRSNPAARTLRTGRTRTIGLVTGVISGRLQACGAQALLNEVRKHGYRLEVELTNYNQDEEANALEELVNRQCAGIIHTLDLNQDSRIYRRLRDLKIPLLLGNDPNRTFSTVSFRIHEALLDAFRLFRERGHSRVALISGRQQRNDYFIELAATYGVELILFPTCWLRRSIRETFKAFAASGIPAVFASASGVMPSLLQYLREENLPCRPDYIYPYSHPFDFLLPEATCLGAIHKPFRERIEMQTTRLIELIEHPDSPRSDLEIPCRLLTPEALRELHNNQLNDPYYDNF